MTRTRITLAAAALCLTALASISVPAHADAVTEWNEIMLDAVRATNTNPPRATRAFAMTHLAMYDAINGIDRVHEPYLVHAQPPGRLSAELAGAAAAYTVLSSLFPDQRPEFHAALWETANSVKGSRRMRVRSAAWGAYVGWRMLLHRRNDGSDATVPYSPSGEFGDWQPTPPSNAPALLPQWPQVRPFGMEAPSQFRVASPPAFDTEAYAIAYNEVKDLGRKDSTLRTADETQIAYFWEDGPGTATPPGHWQTIGRQLSEQFGLSLSDNARLFALLSMVQADAAICSWDNKYHWDHVRPYTAIREEADDDGNPETVADPEWTTLIPTPPFPTYTSGHSTFSGSSARLLGLFLGSDAIPFSAPSPDPQRWPEQLEGVVRSWSTLSEAAEEAGQSRIYGGIHWQYDNTGGLESGRALAEHCFANHLRPLD